ncbi:MAG: type II toxin-antitoxin system HipA family toxin [Aquisalimonadaceae bacterium]
MIDPDSLNVWHGDTLVGHLWRDAQDRLGFGYNKDWVEQGFPLSHTLPLRSERFPPNDGIAHAWFANLLPEAGARERIVRALRVADDDFVLLREIGGDCAGALSVLPVEQDPPGEREYEALTGEAFEQLVLQRGQGAFRHRDSGHAIYPRLSLAGAQDKCPVFLDGGRFSLPQGASASSHILKFELPGWRHVPVYEAFLNGLAAEVGLSVPRTWLGTLGKLRYLVVERFDRRWHGGEIVRLHQEDLCQVAGYRPSRKYEADGGPSFADCMRWTRDISEAPAKDVRSLLRWQIFNFLAGNSDGHAKNLAFVQVEPGADRWRLAPFFDLVCTRAFSQLNRRMAMAVGDQSDPGRITAMHWSALARDCRLRPPFVAREVRRLADALVEAVPAVRARLESGHGELPMLQQPELVIQRQCQRAV